MKGFSIVDDDITIFERDGDFWPVAFDPGPPALLGTSTDDEYKRGFEHVAIWSSHLDPSDGVMIDISPNSIGNATLPASPEDWESFYDVLDGGDSGSGYDLNPVTGQPYPQQIVPRGDYARVLAEFWADGPDSELPPGHWFEILHSVNDALSDGDLRIGGEGEPVDRLEWDVKAYFALGGCMMTLQSRPGASRAITTTLVRSPSFAGSHRTANAPIRSFPDTASRASTSNPD